MTFRTNFEHQTFGDQVGMACSRQLPNVTDFFEKMAKLVNG